MKSFDFTYLPRDESIRQRIHDDPIAIKRGVFNAVMVLSIAVAPVLVMRSFFSEVPMFFPVLWVVVSLFLFAVAIRQILMSYRLPSIRTDLHAFARANDMEYYDEPTFAKHRGVFFELRDDSQLVQVMTTKKYDFSEIGQLKTPYSDGSYELRGYIRIKLPRRLPHMVLDAKSNNFLGKMSNVGDFHGHTISLEGEFSKHFTLHVPEQYATDALYVFTPDIMELFMNSVRDYDCEIIDDDLYIHSDRPFNLLDPSTYEEAQKIAHTLVEKLTRRTDYYADTRVGDRATNTIDPQGERLKERIPLPVKIVLGVIFGPIVIVVAFNFLMLILFVVLMLFHAAGQFLT